MNASPSGRRSPSDDLRPPVRGDASVRAAANRWEAWTLAAILIVAAGLRLVSLGSAPAGVHLDAAANAWSAKCLLEEGRDASGVAWPMVQYRSFGDSRSTLYLYALLPFQAVGGMNPVTTALPSAVGGILAVLALYVVGRRLFGVAAGLLAAAMLAVLPWHIFLSRSGQEAGLAPLLVIGPLAILILAGLPLGNSVGRARPWAAGLAGVGSGLACYGYLAARIVLPLVLVIGVIVSWKRWRELLETRRGKTAALAFASAFLVTIAPLAVAHFTDPTINERAKAVSLWRSSEPSGSLGRVLARYVAHFGPDFLFRRGDFYFWNSVPGTAPLPAFMLPLLLVGLWVTLRDFRANASARVALAWMIVYPAADLLAQHETVHALRSAPGIGALALLAAVGVERAGAWGFRKRRRIALAATGLLALMAAFESARFARVYFFRYARSAEAYVGFGEDILRACAWLRPRLRDADAVIFTGSHPAAAGQTYAFVALGLDHEPRRWFAEDRRVAVLDGRTLCVGFGKIHFVMGDEAERTLGRLASNGRPDRVIYVLRPDEATWSDPVEVIRRPDGEPSLLIFEAVR